MVRAKFRCVKKSQTENGFIVTMEPVTAGSPENEEFFKWTPFGKYEMGLVSEETSNLFSVGSEYYVDFTKA